MKAKLPLCDGIFEEGYDGQTSRPTKCECSPNHHLAIWPILFVSASLSCSVVGFAADAATVDYLADLVPDRLISASQGWGELGLNTAAHLPNIPALPLRIKDRNYAHGLGHHANGELLIELDGDYRTFEADVGVQWQGGQNIGSVLFEVFVDGQKRYDSGVVKEGDEPRTVTIRVAGARELRLVATDAGDGITCDCADWADARLWRDPNAAKRSLAPRVDVAAFGQVATWDPRRTEGTRASRIEEFPAADIFLDTPLAPTADGTYRVPISAEGVGCIGLRWMEIRLLKELALQFADSNNAPGQVELQYWSGESAWQGSWKPLQAAVNLQANRWTWSISAKDLPRGTQKIRCLIPSAKAPLVAENISAYSRSAWRTVDVRIETEGSLGDAKGQIEVYNGAFVRASDDAPGFQRDWSLSSPLSLKVRYSVPTPYKADRTVLRFRLPRGSFGVAVEDLLTNDCVYVPHAGLFVTSVPAPVTLETYRPRIAGRKELLEQVREMPDQTFAQALAKVHHDFQNLGPTMLSLACDNRKFVVHRDGRVVFDAYDHPDDPRPIPNQFELVPQFGGQTNSFVERRLIGGWLPMLETTVKQDGLVYRQRSYVAPLDEASSRGDPSWLHERAVCMIEFSIENTLAAGTNASLGLVLSAHRQPLQWLALQRAAVAISNGRFVADAGLGEDSTLSITPGEDRLVIKGTLAAGAQAKAFVYLPAWKLRTNDAVDRASRIGIDSARNFEAYWRLQLGAAMQVDVPDPLLADVIRASQVHCLMAARNENRGERIAPWISADRYGPLESESNAIIRGMDLFGHEEFARRSFEFFIKRYSPAGFLTTGYTLVGTGEHLWTLAEHFERTGDRAWLQQVAPEVARLCRWIIQQRAKTMRLDLHRQKVPEYSLMPPGVSADWNRFAYRFFNEAQYCAGLTQAARALTEIDHRLAGDWLAEARQYREEVLRAYHWTQARSPVVPLQDGTWVPASPALLDCFGNVEGFLPGEDANRSWAYSVDLGAHHLTANGVVDPASRETAWMANYLEDVQFLRSGMGDYPEASNRKDWFSLGGFAKVQPYYARIAEIYALRDDVKPFIRSYFNAIPSLLSLENLSFWEHFHNQGGWNKTHETGWFLCQTRLMVVMERGEDLWLAPFVTSNWLKDGLKMQVRQAPTRFGKVSYSIASSLNQGRIEMQIQPPERHPPRQILVRLRHPEGKPIVRVSVNNEDHRAFDAQEGVIRLRPTRQLTTVQVHY